RREKFFELMVAIIKKEPDFNLAEERDGYTALHFAVDCNLYHFLDALLKAGAQDKICQKDNNFSALWRAIVKNDVAMVELLLHWSDKLRAMSNQMLPPQQQENQIKEHLTDCIEIANRKN